MSSYVWYKKVYDVLIIINLYLLLPATCWYLWHKNNSINRVFFDCNQSLCFASHSFILNFSFRIFFFVLSLLNLMVHTLFFWGKKMKKKSVGKWKSRKCRSYLSSKVKCDWPMSDTQLELTKNSLSIWSTKKKTALHYEAKVFLRSHYKSFILHRNSLKIIVWNDKGVCVW